MMNDEVAENEGGRGISKDGFSSEHLITREVRSTEEHVWAQVSWTTN